MLNTTPYTATGVRTILTAVASSKAMCGLCPSVLTVKSQPSQVVTNERTRNRATCIQLRIRLHRQMSKLYTNRKGRCVMTLIKCPECGTVPQCYPNCPTEPTAEQCPCFYFGTCPTEGKHRNEWTIWHQRQQPMPRVFKRYKPCGYYRHKRNQVCELYAWWGSKAKRVSPWDSRWR